MNELLGAPLAKPWGRRGGGARSHPGAPTPFSPESGLPEVLEAEKTKGFQKVGGGRLHNWRISQSPDFKLFLKISEDLTAPSLHVPMATPAGAVCCCPADWTALRFSHSLSPTPSPPTLPASQPAARDRGRELASPGLRHWVGRRPCGDMGTVASVPSAYSQESPIGPMATVRGPDPRKSVGYAGLRWPEGPQTHLSDQARDAGPHVHHRGRLSPPGLSCWHSPSVLQEWSLCPFCTGWHLRWHLRPTCLQHDG